MVGSHLPQYGAFARRNTQRMHERSQRARQHVGKRIGRRVGSCLVRHWSSCTSRNPHRVPHAKQRRRSLPGASCIRLDQPLALRQQGVVFGRGGVLDEGAEDLNDWNREI